MLPLIQLFIEHPILQQLDLNKAHQLFKILKNRCTHSKSHSKHPSSQLTKSRFCPNFDQPGNAML
jgi:hypothetical protein